MKEDGNHIEEKSDKWFFVAGMRVFPLHVKVWSNMNMGRLFLKDFLIKVLGTCVLDWMCCKKLPLACTMPRPYLHPWLQSYMKTYDGTCCAHMDMVLNSKQRL